VQKNKSAGIGTNGADPKSKDEAAIAEAALPGMLKEYLPADTDVQQIISSKLQGKKVHIDAADTPIRKKRAKSKIKRITSREKRSLGLYTIPKHCHRYDLFLPLHQLWLGYIDELLTSNASPLVHSQKLIKADYHGAILTGALTGCSGQAGRQAVEVVLSVHILLGNLSYALQWLRANAQATSAPPASWSKKPKACLIS
jgi:ribonuclease P protein subunit POP4